MSNKFLANILLGVLSIGLCFLIYIGFNVWQEAEVAAYESCIGSVSNEIQKSASAKNLFPQDNNWKILSDDETTFLMQNIRGGDCGRFDNPVVDLWNHKINVALRSSPDYPRIIVWSNGKDNISATDDDLVIPYGQKVPK